MTTFTATFPLRTIQLQMQETPQTAREAEAFLLYGNLHNELWCLKMHWLKCLASVQEQKACLQRCEEAYAAMETEAKRYGRMGGYAIEESPVEEDEYTLKLNDLQNLVNTYTACIDECNKGNVAIMDIYKQGEKLREDFDESFSHFNGNYFSPIISDYSNVQVDTVSLDRDFDNFCKCCEEVQNLQQSFYKLWDELRPLGDALDKKTKDTNRHLEIIRRGYEMVNPGNVDTAKAGLN